MYNDLTLEQLEGLSAFSKGQEGSVLDLEAARALISLNASLTAALMKENRRLVNENGALKRRLSRIAEKKHKDQENVVLQDEFPGTGLDSVDVARAGLWCLQEAGVRVSSNKLMLLLYLAYCSYLYHFNQKLFVESPNAIESGPIFWRASKKVGSVVTPVDRDAWTHLAFQSPSVAKFVKNYFAKYADHSEGDLKKLVIRSAPYKDAMKMAAGKGKKAWEISDKDIWIWRDDLKK